MMPCEIISAKLGALFSCAAVDGYTRVRTPFLYPDGDVIDVFIKQAGEQIVITDLGETLRWLRGQSYGMRRTPRQEQLLGDIEQTHGVELFKGMLMCRIRDESEMTDGLMRLSQAAVRVSDLWFTARTRSVQSAVDEVAEYLSVKHINHERNKRLAGRSGRPWRVDFHTFGIKQSCLVNVLSTGSRASAQGVVEHVVAAWTDLSNYAVGQSPLKFVSLFDDTVDVWGAEQFKQVEFLSEVARWSRPDDVEAILRAA